MTCEKRVAAATVAFSVLISATARSSFSSGSHPDGLKREGRGGFLLPSLCSRLLANGAHHADDFLNPCSCCAAPGGSARFRERRSAGCRLPPSIVAAAGVAARGQWGAAADARGDRAGQRQVDWDAAIKRALVG